MGAKRVYLKVGGKGDAVRKRLPSGEIINICECKYNADITENCIGQADVSLLQEIFDNCGYYAPGNFEKLKSQNKHDMRCEYCYAYKNTGNVTPRVVDLKTEEDFKKHSPKIVRLGQLVEVGHPYYFNHLMDFLDLCKKYDCGVIFPTKMFPFGIEGAVETQDFARDNNPTVKNIAKLVKMKLGFEIAEKLKSLPKHSLMYSIGYDRLEPGAVSQGFTNQWRINQAINYHKAGVNTSLTIVCNMNQSIEQNLEKGSSIKSALEAREKFGINTRLLPIRLKKDRLILDLTGKPRKEILYNPNLVIPGLEQFSRFPVADGIEQRPYRRRGNQELAVMFIHDDFKKLIEGGMGVCGSIGFTEYCDGCNLDKRRISFSIKDIPKIVYDKKAAWKRKRKKDNEVSTPLFIPGQP